MTDLARNLPRRTVLAASGTAVLAAAAACSSPAATSASTSSAPAAATSAAASSAPAVTSSSSAAATSSAAASTASSSAAAKTTAKSSSSAAPTGTPIAKTADVDSAGALIVDGPSGPVLLASSAGTVVAHTAVCTHQGCTIAASGACPCHGSKFNVTTGAVENGPAQQPLAEVAVTVSGGQVYAS